MANKDERPVIEEVRATKAKARRRKKAHRMLKSRRRRGKVRDSNKIPSKRS